MWKRKQTIVAYDQTFAHSIISKNKLLTRDKHCLSRCFKWRHPRIAPVEAFTMVFHNSRKAPGKSWVDFIYSAAEKKFAEKLEAYFPSALVLHLKSDAGSLKIKGENKSEIRPIYTSNFSYQSHIGRFVLCPTSKITPHREGPIRFFGINECYPIKSTEFP